MHIIQGILHYVTEFPHRSIIMHISKVRQELRNIWSISSHTCTHMDQVCTQTAVLPVQRANSCTSSKQYSSEWTGMRPLEEMRTSNQSMHNLFILYGTRPFICGNHTVRGGVCESFLSQLFYLFPCELYPWGSLKPSLSSSLRQTTCEPVERATKVSIGHQVRVMRSMEAI